MPPNRFESEVESFLEGSHGDRTHIKRADHHTVTPLCGTLLRPSTHNLSAYTGALTIGRYEPTAHHCPPLQEYTPNDAYRTAHRFLALQGRTPNDAHPTTRCTPHTSRAPRTSCAPRTTAPGTHPPPAHTKRARTNRSGRATYSAQALGRLPWFAPFLRRSRRLRPRFDMSFSLGLLSRLKHFCTHWPKPPRHRPFAATKVTEKRAVTPASSACVRPRGRALPQGA